MRCSRPALRVNVLLPVGISFYTFTQIAFLVDAYRGNVARYALPHYALFVTYFPHLIAGPILHHRDMIPQFERAESQAARSASDPVRPDHLRASACSRRPASPTASSRWSSLAFGPNTPTFDQAWLGALAYTFQLYFDFSGYSDMAIGISLMFGIFLPLNFNSPYKATSIIDFWRRWHMTLSQFLRDYLYIPLGGNRRGPVLRYVNLLITMLLGGLWHGAAWTFVVWGALHGAYLCINHAWNKFGPDGRAAVSRRWPISPAFILTFLAVVVAWVFFRADSMPTALNVLSKMADPANIAFGRLEIAQAVFIAGLCRDRVVRAEHAGRSWVTITGTGRWGEGLRRLADAPAVHLRNRGRAGVRDSRNPAAQRIHLFQVLMSNPAKYLPRFLGAAALVIALAVAAQFRGRSRCSCSGRRGCSRRCIRTDSPHAECRADPKPAFRHGVHGHVARRFITGRAISTARSASAR